MLERIKQFFRKIFKIRNQQYIEAISTRENNSTKVQKENFKQQIKEKIEKEKAILKLQKDFELGLKNGQYLSKDDYVTLCEFYEKQIEKTKQSIRNYKKGIETMREKLAQNN